MMRLLIVRHGATQNNLEARFTGHADVPLSDLGARQVQALAARLAETHLDAIVSSDLRRALATAEPIARTHGLEIQRDADLREISMGVWTDRTGTSIRAEDPDLVARWESDPLNVAPPGGETVLQLRNRVVRAIDRWYAAYPTGTVLWVTHGGLLATLLCHILGMDHARRWQFRRDNAALTALEISERGALLVRLNDAAHLAHLADGAEGERSQVL
jgi:broad specificity phosphatase PhoE